MLASQAILAPGARSRSKSAVMEIALYHMTTIAVFAVLIVLILGLATLLRGKNSNLSQKLMRWRIGLQFVAIVIIMVFVLIQRA